MAEVDAVFCSLFRDDPEAAMLACDEAGLFPEELLHLPKAVFFMGIESEEQGLIRYNMRERFRQEMFRKVFALKKSILLKGNVLVKWVERNDMFPDAPGIPDLSKFRKKLAEKPDGTIVDETEELDTESDDDGLDEFFRPKPKPKAPTVASPTPVSPAHPTMIPHPPGSSNASAVGGSGPAFSLTSPMKKTSDLIAAQRGTALVVQPAFGSPAPSVSSNTARPTFTTDDSSPSQQPPVNGSAPKLLVSNFNASLSSRSFRKVAEVTPPPKPVVPPHPPQEPPRAKALTARALEREERLLEVSRKRLATYGLKVEKSVEMILAERKKKTATSTNAPQGPQQDPILPIMSNSTSLGTSGFLLHSPRNGTPPTPSVAARDVHVGQIATTTLPRIPLSHMESKRQLSSLVRQCMVRIAESAIGYNTYREDMDEQETLDWERSIGRHNRQSTSPQTSVSRQRSGDPFQPPAGSGGADVMSREAWAAQAEARRLREEAQRRAANALAEEYERFSAEKDGRTQQVLRQRRFQHVLSNEVRRMRQILAQEKRACLTRKEDARVSKIVARSAPKQQQAEMFVENRRREAELKKLQHVQLELLRKELLKNVDDMNIRCEWEVPQVLEHLMTAPASRNTGGVDGSAGGARRGSSTGSGGGGGGPSLIQQSSAGNSQPAVASIMSPASSFRQLPLPPPR